MDADYDHEIIQKKTSGQENSYQEIRDYYDIAGPDYECWSRNFNMHFGYCRKLADVFFLERMLMNMNDEVLNELKIAPGVETSIADLGCGVGTVARFIAKKCAGVKITGFTISSYQIEKARTLVALDGLTESISIARDNFEHLGVKTASYTHAYALESACHAHGDGKDLFISELSRILKTGGRFCIADGFLKQNNRRPWLFNFLYKKIIKYWAVPCFGNLEEVRKNLETAGFIHLSIREVSYRIAPSVTYVPWTCLKFFLKEIWKNKSLRMKKERWHNVYAPVLGMILGLYRKQFGYYIISGQKH